MEILKDHGFLIDSKDAIDHINSEIALDLTVWMGNKLNKYFKGNRNFDLQNQVEANFDVIN